MVAFTDLCQEKETQLLLLPDRTTCEAVILAPCLLTSCTCHGQGGLLLMVTGKETRSFSKLRSDFSHGCMVAQTRARGMAILNRKSHRGHPSSSLIGVPQKRLIITYKSIPLFDVVYAQPPDKTMLLFYVCPRIHLEPALFFATGESYLHGQEFADRSEATDAAQVRIRIVLLIQPPALSPLERAITAMVPGEPAPPALLLMDNRWAVGGSLAHSAIRRQQAAWRLRDESGSTAPMEEHNSSLPHMRSESPLSMAGLFKTFVARHNSEERI